MAGTLAFKVKEAQNPTDTDTDTFSIKHNFTSYQPTL